MLHRFEGRLGPPDHVTRHSPIVDNESLIHRKILEHIERPPAFPILFLGQDRAPLIFDEFTRKDEAVDVSLRSILSRHGIADYA